MYQTWSHLLFLHWEWDAAAIQRTLPSGLHVDTFGGSAWVGLVPFFMRNIRPRYLPAVPWVSYFLELNVRTYVHDDEGRPGVWFYSLDCNQPLAVWTAQTFFHLPYQHARMTAEFGTGKEIHYRCHRVGAPEALNSVISWEPPPPLPSRAHWSSSWRSATCFLHTHHAGYSAVRCITSPTPLSRRK
nr:DUF2071 domain-containing protein [Verrucomicrobium spinosum]